MSDLSDLESQFANDTSDEVTYVPFVAAEESRDEKEIPAYDYERGCVWCERARSILFGTAAVAIGLFFVAIGIDLATGGKLSGLFVLGSDDDSASGD